MEIAIRNSQPEDLPQMESLYQKAFPDEDLLPLVKDLLAEGPAVLSLVAVDEQVVIGNVIFTLCQIDENSDKLALLAPLGVSPDYQGKGIGSLLTHTGIEQMEKNGVRQVFVLGDPNYYRRFGFSTEKSIMPPYDLPPEWSDAWQSKVLVEGAPQTEGKLSLPEVWLKPELWLP